MGLCSRVCRLLVLAGVLLSASVTARLDVQAGKVVEQVRKQSRCMLQDAHAGSLVFYTAASHVLCLQLTKLASFSDDPFPAVTRILFTKADLQARE